jgi:RNA polymerase sigma factor (sigma-70 family)
MDVSENTIWYSFLSGDKNAFSVIFKMNYSELYNYGLKFSKCPSLTKDCLQDLFIYIYTHRDSITEVKSIKSYLFISFRRALLKKLKDERRFIDTDVESVYVSNFEFSPEEIAIQQEISNIKSDTLTNILNNLPPREREAIYLKYYSELKVSEISSIMNISYQSVLNTIQKAFKKIRNATENEMISNILKKN